MIPFESLQLAPRVALIAAGIYFLVGLVTGVWKYWHMSRSAAAVAPAYVDIAHRASLQYAFASLLLMHFAYYSAWSATVNLWATALPLAFFGLAIGSYVLHGLLQDTDNQLRRPHQLGNRTLPRQALAGFMWALVAAEVGGFGVLFLGVCGRWPG